MTTVHRALAAMTTAVKATSPSPVPPRFSAGKCPGRWQPGRYDRSVTNQTPSVAAGTALVVVSHNEQQAERIATRRVQMTAGLLTEVN